MVCRVPEVEGNVRTGHCIDKLHILSDDHVQSSSVPEYAILVDLSYNKNDGVEFEQSLPQLAVNQAAQLPVGFYRSRSIAGVSPSQRRHQLALMECLLTDRSTGKSCRVAEELMSYHKRARTYRTPH